MQSRQNCSLALIFSAGDSDYHFCANIEEIRWFAENSGVDHRRQIQVYRGHSLPLRGCVTDSLIAVAMNSISDKTESTVLHMTRRRGFFSVNHCFGHQELISELHEEFGEPVAVGVLPDTGIDRYSRNRIIEGGTIVFLNRGCEFAPVWVP